MANAILSPINQIRRRPVNPLDKSTIVSIFPQVIVDKKETIFPGYNTIPAAPDNDYSILVVGPASWWKEMDEGQAPLEIQTSSLDIAESIVRDFKLSVLASNGYDKSPGLFVIPGNHKKESIKDWVNPEDPTDTFKTRIEFAKNQQKAWFAELVMIADADWAVTNGNPRSVSEISRLAAMYLGFADKPWLQDFKSVMLQPCTACGELVNPDYPVCKNCHAIVNRARAKELGIVFALNLSEGK